MRRVLFICVVVFLAALFIRPIAAQNVLPPTFGNCISSPTSGSQPFTLEQAVGANASVIREYGFEAIEHREYSQAKGKCGLAISLFRMVDPTAAYGAFTFLRPPGTLPSDLAKYAAINDDHGLHGLIVVGNFLLDVRGGGLDTTISDLKLLVSAIKSKADSRPFPIIVEHLPPAGLIEGSERYVSGPLALHALLPVADGDWLGFSRGAEAVLALYHNKKDGQNVTLLIAEYPTQQIAASRFELMSPILHPPAGAGVGRQLRVIASRRDAGLISIVLSTRPTAYADALLGQIIFGHNVVWNEPSFKANDLPWSAYIIGAFLGSGIFIVFALVSGLGFAAIRLVVKYFFPGKVFDRRRTMEVIQLDLNGRQVNTKDFY